MPLMSVYLRPIGVSRSREALAARVARAGLPVKLATSVCERMVLLVQELTQSAYAQYKSDARARIGCVDRDD